MTLTGNRGISRDLHSSDPTYPNQILTYHDIVSGQEIITNHNITITQEITHET